MAKNSKPKNKKTAKTKRPSYLPDPSKIDRNLHQRNLCLDSTQHFHMLEAQREDERKLKSFYDAGDTQEEIEDTDEYRRLADPNSLLRVYERMSRGAYPSTNTKYPDNPNLPPTPGRFTTEAVVQLVHVSTTASNLENALLVAFRGTKETLQFTKAEYKLAKMCYKFGQADLHQQVIKQLFFNPQIAANMKILSQMKQYIDNSTDNATNVAASLNISLTKKKEHKRPKPKADQTQSQTDQSQTTPTPTPTPLEIN